LRYERPKIYVCLEGQYNYTQGQELGYSYVGDFLSGRSLISNSTDATWQGNTEGNKSIEEVMDTLYNFNYTEARVQGFDIYPKDVADIHSSTEFIMPYGYCLALNQTKDFKFLSVSNYEQVKVVLVDPYSANKVVMKEGAATTFGPGAKDTGHEFLLYQAHFNIYDQVCEKS
jgi:hypothetical protein